jgi:hypothetical protein
MDIVARPRIGPIKEKFTIYAGKFGGSSSGMTLK